MVDLQASENGKSKLDLPTSSILHIYDIRKGDHITELDGMPKVLVHFFACGRVIKVSSGTLWH